MEGEHERFESWGMWGQVSGFLTLSPLPPFSHLQGCIPTMARAVVVNAAQLASYSQSKQFLLDSGERPRAEYSLPSLA